jgi:hypothetical protein
MHHRLDLPRNLWSPTGALAAGLASTLPALIACSDSQGETSFHITNVAFDNESTITLTFSQPVGELGAVDPNDFRLSMAQTQRATTNYNGVTELYEHTSYSDLRVTANDYDTYDQPFSFMLIEAGAPNQLVLRTTAPLGPGACEHFESRRSMLEYYAEIYPTGNVAYDVAIFLHYAADAGAGDIPIESEAGELLADIGRDWVLNAEDYVERESYGFTMLSPQLRIPCP